MPGARKAITLCIVCNEVYVKNDISASSFV